MKKVKKSRCHCTQSVKDVEHEAMNALIAVIDAMDPETRRHSCHVAEYALLLAQELKLPFKEIETIYYGALLHDIGKIGISPDILKKRTRLTVKEFALIMQHPTKGANIVSQITDFKPFVHIVLYHHERFDGSGYPEGLKGKKIPFNARLVALVDAYDAMTSKRSYRQAKGREKALDEIIKSTPSQFDPELVKAFVRVVKNF
jgi:putative nucleotidyltransferase with HDIG domain